ncbi:hypothetical protein V502_03335 [Pseudogymnoascus sp. VKM F-4520 (FW-2644)]|nr:hypothetical protein V502_03335 [Pseudogymnoascus sp. VKM F-4520 (FW-2644)]
MVAQRSMYHVHHHGTGACDSPKTIPSVRRKNPLCDNLALPSPQHQDSNLAIRTLQTVTLAPIDSPLNGRRGFTIVQLFAPTICEAELQAAQHRGAFCFSQPTAFGSSGSGAMRCMNDELAR